MHSGLKITEKTERKKSELLFFSQVKYYYQIRNQYQQVHNITKQDQDLDQKSFHIAIPFYGVLILHKVLQVPTLTDEYHLFLMRLTSTLAE